jgi:hypothetical protein
MDDVSAGRTADPVASLAALLRAVALSADGIQGGQRWRTLAELVNGPEGNRAGPEPAGAAELAALREEPTLDQAGMPCATGAASSRSRPRGARSLWLATSPPTPS